MAVQPFPKNMKRKGTALPLPFPLFCLEVIGVVDTRGDTLFKGIVSPRVGAKTTLVVVVVIVVLL